MCINCLSVWILWFLPENVSTPRSSGMESHPATSALPHPAVCVLRLRSMPYSLLVTGGNPAVCDSHLPADNYGCRSGWTFHHLWNVPDTADTCRNLFSDIPLNRTWVRLPSFCQIHLIRTLHPYRSVLSETAALLSTIHFSLWLQRFVALISHRRQNTLFCNT